MNKKALLAIINECSSADYTSVITKIQDQINPYNCNLYVLNFKFCNTPSYQYKSNDSLRVTTLTFPEKFQYGELIKIIFDYSILNNFDFVILYDSELRYPAITVVELLKTILDNESDLSIAIPAIKTRDKCNYSALKNSIQPEAKFIANILNAVTKTQLSSWHCGFRAYKVSSLSRIPYKYNSSDREFNTEIIIQFLLSNYKITEVPSFGYKHQHLSYLEKIQYGFKMTWSCLLSLLHRLNIFYQRQFDLKSPADTYNLKLGYLSSHTMALSHIDNKTRSVLDIGCSTGSLLSIIANKGIKVHGIDQHEISCTNNLESYLQIDLDVKNHTFETKAYDKILILDVLEHLRFPDTLLEHIRTESSGLNFKPTIIISVPNVAFIIIRIRLLFGSFNYGKLGILDMTHTRLYTEKSIILLLKQSGYYINSVSGIPVPFPKAIGNNILSRLLVSFNIFLIKLNRRLFSYQILVTATPRPMLNDLSKI